MAPAALCPLLQPLCRLLPLGDHGYHLLRQAPVSFPDTLTHQHHSPSHGSAGCPPQASLLLLATTATLATDHPLLLPLGPAPAGHRGQSPVIRVGEGILFFPASDPNTGLMAEERLTHCQARPLHHLFQLTDVSSCASSLSPSLTLLARPVPEPSGVSH